MQPKESVVLYPSVGMGHLIPMVELAKLFSAEGFSVTIIVIELPFDTSSAAAPFISRVSAAYPSISFHRLPKVTPTATTNPRLIIFETLRLSNRHLLDFLSSSSNVIKALVLDMFCTSALDVADELGLASYIFFASAASTLAAFLMFPTLRSQLLEGGDDIPVHFPGLPPMTACDFPHQMLERDVEEGSETMSDLFDRFPRADGIVVNTFESLEKRAVQALVDGLCVPPGRVMPPIYCIGPLTAETGEIRHECLTWLDGQPEKSVVFLCFGSMGSFSVEQLREMASGLERSGQRFLWVVRSPPGDDDPAGRFGAKPEPDLEVLLPEGFLERTERQGKVVRSWAPQVAVLGHRSVGAFVSHCGWNSTLEAVRSGVPIIAWPLYAEQRMNKVFLVDAEIAAVMEGHDEEFVSAEEVETKIKSVMESEMGKVLKEAAVAMKERAVAAQKEDGSSTVAWKELVAEVRQKNGFGQGLHQ